MATTIVYPSWDVSGTLSASTIVSTAGTFAGSLTASTFAVTGTSTFSGTAVFLTTAQFAGTVTMSATVVFLTGAIISGSLSVGTLYVSTTTTLSGAARTLGPLDVSATASVGALIVAGAVSVVGAAIFKGTITVSATASVGFLTVAGVPVASGAYTKLVETTAFAGVTFFKASGTWSSYYSVDVQVACKGAATTTNLIVGLFADGGTTPFMVYTLNPVASATASEMIAFLTITGTKDGHAAVIWPHFQIFPSVTNNAGQAITTTFTASGI